MPQIAHWSRIAFGTAAVILCLLVMVKLQLLFIRFFLDVVR
jgi:hypothetical protein